MAIPVIRFDWAMKKLLRHKANFDILEGFLSELFGKQVTIKQILESESNQEFENDKFNRVDILVEFEGGELVIVEVQNSKEYDYFHRILYGTSKVISEHIKKGKPYGDVKKVISITIAYFDLGQGKDYVYHGTTSFKGIHKKDVLTLAKSQMEMYRKQAVSDIFPEYWIIKISNFHDRIKDKLDEWIYFFKNSEIKKGFSAQGLREAAERLHELTLNEQEAKAYRRYLERLHDIASQQVAKMVDVQELLEKERAAAIQKGREEGLEKGREEGIEQGRTAERELAIVALANNGIPVELIAKTFDLSVTQIRAILEKKA